MVVLATRREKDLLERLDKEREEREPEPESRPTVTVLSLTGKSKTRYAEVHIFFGSIGTEVTQSVTVARIGVISKDGGRKPPGERLTQVATAFVPSDAPALAKHLLPKTAKWEEPRLRRSFPIELDSLPPDHPAVELWRAANTSRPRYWTCSFSGCNKLGVYESQTNLPNFDRYTLCNKHRPDLLHPEVPAAVCDMGHAKVLHLVRRRQGSGGTPGDTLCGLARFGPRAEGVGWGMHPFDPAAAVQSQATSDAKKPVCEECLAGYKQLLTTPEYLLSRVLFLEERSSDLPRKLEMLESENRLLKAASERLVATENETDRRLVQTEVKIREANERLNLTQDKLARLSALVTTTLSDLEDRLSERDEDFVWGLIDGLTHTLHKHNKLIANEIEAEAKARQSA